MSKCGYVNFLIFQPLLSFDKKFSLWKQNETESYKPKFLVKELSNIKAIFHVNPTQGRRIIGL